jgi:galactokinase
MQEELKQRFASRFGDTSKVRLYAAPGRVNLIGEHTDCHGGYVLPAPISFGIRAAARVREDSLVRLYSENFPTPEPVTFSLEELIHKKEDGWANYPKGVLWAFRNHGHIPSSGFEALFQGDLPAGGGLSSSAALEVLTGVILQDLFGFALETPEALTLAKLGQEAENRFMGVQSGIMDQCAIALGTPEHALFLNSQTLEYRSIPVPLKEHVLFILDSRKSRELTTSAYNLRRQECAQALKELQQWGSWQALGEISPEEFAPLAPKLSDPLLRRRARHVILENHRTQKAAQVLEAGDLKSFGRLMNRSHLSLQFDYEVSCRELDCLVECSWQHPACDGARMTGAGFGGCAVALVRNEGASAFEEEISAVYLRHMERECSIYRVSIPGGAGRLG